MKVWVIVACLVGLGVAVYALWRQNVTQVVSPVGQIFEKPFDTYTIERLGQRQFSGSQIVLDQPVSTTSAFTAYNFHFISEGKKVTGLAHIPNNPTLDSGNQRIKVDQKRYPVIVQFRGYVDRERYVTGEGTRRSSQVYAANGFITLAPDFLGYGGSDMPSVDIFEERFQTYIVALDLLASVKTLPAADPDRIGIWGHSNGGQIALTVLEASQKPYPTTLWAPVTKPFPYSVLFYTDEASDRGKLIRKRLAQFEQDYDVELYSLPNYVNRITASIQLHQGSNDDSVPIKWNDEFVQILANNKINYEYFTYSGSDHNMMPFWSTVVSRDIAFFRKHLR